MQEKPPDIFIGKHHQLRMQENPPDIFIGKHKIQ